MNDDSTVKSNIGKFEADTPGTPFRRKGAWIYIVAVVLILALGALVRLTMHDANADLEAAISCAVEARNEAFFTLETDGLSTCMTGEFLRNIALFVDRLQEFGDYMVVETALTFQNASSTSGEYTTVYVLEDGYATVFDIETSEIVYQYPAELLEMVYALIQVDGTWKVAGATELSI